MKELFEIVFNISMIVFVAGSMITLGLSLSVSQIIEPFKNTKMVILSIIANFIVVPLFTFGLLWAFHVPEGVRIGLLLLSIGGGAPFIPKIVEVAKGNVPDAIGLMLLLLIVTIFFMPFAVPVLFPGSSVSAWNIARSLIFTMLLPLILGLFVKARFSTITKRIHPVTEKLTNISVLIMIVAVLFLYTRTIISHAGDLPIIFLFFLGAMGIGFCIGGKDRDARIVLSVGTGLRNPPVAILVASQNFPTEPMAAMTPLLVIIIGLSILFPLALKIGKNDLS